MSDSRLGQVLGSALSVLLACTATAVSRSMTADPAPVAPVGAAPLGRDVSWPNCPRGLGIPSRPTQGKPMPPASARFVVVGLTNGPAFHPNPCLAAQVDYARQRHLWASAYAVVTHPTREQLRRYGAAGPADPGSRLGRLRNSGWAQARQNVAAMRAVGLRPPLVWVDVEPVSAPAPWSHRHAANRAVLMGSVAAYHRAGLQVGFYSTPTMWRAILGPLDLGFPEWRTAGLSTRRAAFSMCRRHRFQGGPAVIAQWYTAREDLDLLCPGQPAELVLAEYFARL